MTVENKMGLMHKAGVQVVIVGVLALLGPGLFNALNGLGGAGSSDPRVAAMANGCLYCMFAVTGYFGGVAFNLFGPVPLFTLGGAAYAFYATCAFFSAKIWWLSPLGGAILGIGAGLFWTAQGSLMMAYATPQTRGRLIALFWVIFNLGGMLGGLLEFGLNYENEGGSANPTSYFVLIALMAVGAAAAPCVLVHPSKVVKEDGTAIVFEQVESPMSEIWAALLALKDPFVKFAVVFFFASNWFYTYDFNGFNGQQFTVRTRGLNSALFWAAQMLAAWIFGAFLDTERLSVLQRASRGLAINAVLLVLSLGPAALDNFSIACGGRRGWDKGMPCDLDLQNFPMVLPPMIIYILLGASDAIYQTYAYWLMSTAAGSDVRKTVMYAAIYKGVQSFGAGMAWLLDLNDAFTYKAQVIVALVLTLGACLAVIPSFKYLTLENKCGDIEAKPSGEHSEP